MSKTLITKLEQVGEGSRELDWEIARAVYGGGEDAVLLPNGPPLPHYTTSLDAKLPGENITHIALRHNGLWTAQQVLNEFGHVTVGIGHTEALARRVASLKARE